MPLDPSLLRTSEGITILKDSQVKRFEKVEIIDELVQVDNKRQKYEVDQLKYKLNQLNTEIGAFYKEKKGEKSKLPESLKVEYNNLELLILKETKIVDDLNNEFLIKFNNVGNIISNSAYISNNEETNPIYKSYTADTEIKSFPLTHDKLLDLIGGFDSERGAKIAGHRGFFLLNDGVALNMALQQYALNFLRQRNFNIVQPPYFMHSNIMAKTAQLSDFAESLYTFNDEGSSHDKLSSAEQQKVLIATSEQPISAYHMDEHLKPESLPLNYAGFSTCFRKEAGKHGVDNAGVFRVHQFDKVEQFCITSPTSSNEALNKTLENCENFYQSLGLTYRVVSIASASYNSAASLKYDLEALFPSRNVYRELCSMTNCTDYQSRALNIRYGFKDSKKGTNAEKKTEFVHLINATLCATQRTMACILENYQKPEGVIVPKVLVPYMGGKDFLPFIKKPDFQTRLFSSFAHNRVRPLSLRTAIFKSVLRIIR